MRIAAHKCKQCSARISRERHYKYDSMCKTCRPPLQRVPSLLKNSGKRTCVICSAPISKNSKLCRKCYFVNLPEKFKISREELEKLLQETSLQKIADAYRVHVKTVTKKCKVFKLRLPKSNEKYKVWAGNRGKLIISETELARIIWEMPTEQVGKLFGVSGKTVEKRCKKLGIPKPPRGYWATSSRFKSG